MSLSGVSQRSTLRPVATGLAVIAAIVYVVIALGFVPDGFESPPAPVMFVAGLAYLAGGVLILRAGRRLLLIGLILNLLVLVIFGGSVLAGRATVDALSVTGKIAQVGLEVVLFMLVFGQRPRR